MNSPDLDDQLESDVYSNLPSRNDFSTGIMTRRNRTSCKSKHSETEQRRRSKINERFQNLMDIIPQNDQKRDKASFLLEVIEYIHFLQEKVQMYEGSQQMWYQAPTKLIPWRNSHGPVAEVIDQSQIGKSFSSYEKVAPPFGLLSDMESSVDRYVDLGASTKILEHSSLSAVSSYKPTEPLPQFVQHEFWQPRSCCGSMNCKKNELSNSDEKTSASPLSAHKGSTVETLRPREDLNRVQHTLTEALKSSGVNMSETMISVQLSLQKRSECEYSFTAFPSEDNCNSIADEEGDSPTEARSICKNLDHSQKRIRR